MNLSTNQRHPIEALYRGLDVEDHDTAVSVIVKTRGETCDIDCLYCYEKRKEAPGGARVGTSQIRSLATSSRAGRSPSNSTVASR